ncbi:MAG: hypothetical protein K2O13_03560 [Lachnospiraceae bacterium]|nr:hypothetical protein [Lachnospiraceae bacterium]
MNIFIVHSGADRDYVYEKKEEIKNSCSKANILLLEYRKIWRPEARRLMKSAQMILYIVGKESYKSRNINWELKEAIKLNKSVVYLKIEDTCRLNKVLQAKDPFTKEDIELADRVFNVQELVDIIMSYENGKYINLINDNTSNDSLFEQYRMFSDTSEALVNRRQNVNSFYITANTALITIAATAFSLNGDLISKLAITIVLTIPGILLNHSWAKILESYGIINSSKMKILGMLERQLAASLYDAEWQAMSNKYNKKQYISFTDGEKSIPSIFNGVYIVVDLICIAFLLYILKGQI